RDKLVTGVQTCALPILTDWRVAPSYAALMKRPGDSDWARMTGWDRPFPQIATGDLDIAVVGQLPPPNLSLGDQFEPGPVKVIGRSEERRVGKEGRARWE